MSTPATLAAEQRTPGSTQARILRRSGKVPATLYGHGADPLSITVETKEFHELLRTGAGHHLMTLTIDGKNKDSVLLRSVQRHPLSQVILHADFQRVGSDEAIRASVTLTLKGIAAGVKNNAGVMDVLLHQIEITGPASQLPEHLEFDTTSLEINSVVHASQIPLPAGFTLVTTPESVVLTLEAPRTSSADAAAEAKASEATSS